MQQNASQYAAKQSGAKRETKCSKTQQKVEKVMF